MISVLHSAAEVIIRVTHAGPLAVGGKTLGATGGRIEAEEMWVFDLDPDGLIVEERDYLDTSALVTQLEAAGLSE